MVDTPLPDIPKMSVKQLINAMNLDKDSLIILFDSADQLKYDLEINPSEFIQYAEQDLLDDSPRGLVNALTNSKRAIDSEIDKTLHCFGINSKSKNFPQKVDLIKKLGFIAPRILSKVVSRRNYLEHEYVKPDKGQVEDAIDIANLFIMTIDGKLRLFTTSFLIINELPEDHELYDLKKAIYDNAEKELFFQFYEKEKRFYIRGKIIDLDSTYKDWRGLPITFIGEAEVTRENACYLPLISIACSTDPIVGPMDMNLYEEFLKSL